MENIRWKKIYSVVEEMNLFLLTPIGVSRGIFAHYICNAFVFLGDVALACPKVIDVKL